MINLLYLVDKLVGDRVVLLADALHQFQKLALVQIDPAYASILKVSAKERPIFDLLFCDVTLI